MASSKEKEKTPYEEEVEDSEESEEINRDAGDTGDDAVSEQAGTEDEEDEDVSAPPFGFFRRRRRKTRRALSLFPVAVCWPRARAQLVERRARPCARVDAPDGGCAPERERER
jgi:hypothetical protein